MNRCLHSHPGAIQIYKNEYNEVILGAVGQLQFEVFEYRLKNEYNSDIRMEPLNFSVARWVDTTDTESLKEFVNSRCSLVFDRFERPILLFANQYTLDNFAERHKDITLMESFSVKSLD